MIPVAINGILNKIAKTTAILPNDGDNTTNNNNNNNDVCVSLLDQENTCVNAWYQ